jgi:hypothetical protein
VGQFFDLTYLIKVINTLIIEKYILNVQGFNDLIYQIIKLGIKHFAGKTKSFAPLR